MNSNARYVFDTNVLVSALILSIRSRVKRLPRRRGQIGPTDICYRPTFRSRQRHKHHPRMRFRMRRRGTTQALRNDDIEALSSLNIRCQP